MGRASSCRSRRLVGRGATSFDSLLLLSMVCCLLFEFLLLGALELGGIGGAIFGDLEKDITETAFCLASGQSFETSSIDGYGLNKTASRGLSMEER